MLDVTLGKSRGEISWERIEGVMVRFGMLWGLGSDMDGFQSRLCKGRGIL